MFANLKPRLAPHMVSKAGRERQFWAVLESSLPDKLDSALDGIWNDCLDPVIKQQLKRPVTSSYRAFKDRVEDFFCPKAVVFFAQIGDDGHPPQFQQQHPGETPEEVLDRFWREALSASKGFPPNAVLASASGGDNPIPRLARRMAGAMYALVHLPHMASVLSAALESILADDAADINDPDVWTSRLLQHQYY